MDTVTALIGDIDMATAMSKNSSFVAESKKSPHYQKMLQGLKEISVRNSHLTDEEVESLRRRRNNIYSKRMINDINSREDFEFASKHTVQMAAILSNRKDDLAKGALSIATRFATPALDIIEDITYSGTTGMRKKEDGTRDHTAKRTYATSNDVELNEYLSLSMDDRKRAMRAADVVNKVDSDIDPFDAWVNNEILKKQAAEARRNVRNVSSSTNDTDTSESSTGELNWRNLI